MKTIDLQEFRAFLVSLIEEVRDKPASPYFDGALLVLTKQLHFIHAAQQKGEEPNMQKMKQEIQATIMKMGDIPHRTREGYWPNKIKEDVATLERLVSEWEKSPFKTETEKLRNKPVLGFSAEQVRSGQLHNLVKTLKERREIPENIRVQKRGDVVCLVLD